MGEEKLGNSAIERLKAGETIEVKVSGNSMTPKVKYGDTVTLIPVDENTELKKNDIVFCKVKGHYYLHLISAIKGKKVYQISNNHGHVNGSIGRDNIFGKKVKG